MRTGYEQLPLPASPEYAGWPAAAQDLVEAAIDQHGGWARWKSLHSIRLRLAKVSGILPFLKGYKRTFWEPLECEVLPHERICIFYRYPDPDHEGIFANGDVRLRALQGGVISDSPNHRATFELNKWRLWNSLDALYFFGYSAWHYHTVPFTLGRASFVRLHYARRRGAALTGVEVDLPRDVHSHSRRQIFYFDGTGRIRRHDYVSEIVSRLARASHFWEDYERVNGFLIARCRHVTLRVGGQPAMFPALHVQFAEPRVTP